MDLAILNAINAKMHYLSQKQDVIAQNIANANTPDFQPKELGSVDFSSRLKKLIDAPAKHVGLINTQSGHITGHGDTKNPRVKEQRQTYDVNISGNAVVLEEQMVKAGRTKMEYELMTSLYKKQGMMLKAALAKIT